MGAITSCCGHDQYGGTLTAEELLRGANAGEGVKYPATADESKGGGGKSVDPDGQAPDEGSIYSARTSASPSASLLVADGRGAAAGKSKDSISKSPRTMAEWQERAQRGTKVNVVFPDGHRITCDFQLDMEIQALFLTFNEKVRSIPLSDVATVLYGADCEQLDETERELLLDDHVVGIKLLSSGRAIAFSFNSLEDAHCFVYFCHRMLPS